MRPWFDENGKLIYDGTRMRIGIDSFSTPRFNRGLGSWVSSYREEERIAKVKGLRRNEDAKMPKQESISEKVEPILVEGLKKIRRS